MSLAGVPGADFLVEGMDAPRNGLKDRHFADVPGTDVLVETGRLRNAAERLVTWLTSQVPILPFIASKWDSFQMGLHGDRSSLHSLSSVKFAGAKAEADATHIAAISCLVPVEILDLEWQVQRVSPMVPPTFGLF